MILALDMAGHPSRWLMIEEAITYQARRMVAWSMGEVVAKWIRLTGAEGKAWP